MESIKLKANAKINLFLDISGKRQDGFHNIYSVFQSIKLFDIITVTKIDNGIEIECSDKEIPIDQSNTAYQICEQFSKHIGSKISVKINIEKKIPSQAGLGGGSADGAAVLYALNKLYNTDLSKSEIVQISDSVGSDIPFCYFGGTAIVTGKGEKIEPVNSICYKNLAIIKPEFSVSTAWAYSNYNQEKIKPIDKVCIVDKLVSGAGFYNVFEEICSEEYPEIKDIKRKCIEMGAKTVLMTGSGSAFFILADKESLDNIVSYYYNQGLFVWLGSTDRNGLKEISS